jgi:hypothetical protein
MLNRTTTFALAAITTIATTALAPTGAFAHFSGGNFGGGFAGVGHVATTSAIPPLSAPTGGHSIPRSSVIARYPVGSTKTGGHRIPTTSDIPKLIPTPPNPIKDPKHVWPKPVWNGPIGIPVVIPVGAPIGETDGGTVGAVVDGQVAPTAQVNCNCLTRQDLPDGSVLFQDICKKQSAFVTPDELKAQAQGVAASNAN